MGKDKLRKFRENETFKCLIQPATSEVLGVDYPLKGRWGSDFFGNDNPIVLELGCGKGRFTAEQARRDGDVLLLAIENSKQQDVSRLIYALGIRQVGAKTGSAQVSAQTESNAVFVCFAPYENPEVAMAIVVEHGGSGGELAAIASDVLSYYFSARETQEAIPQENTLIR